MHPLQLHPLQPNPIVNPGTNFGEGVKLRVIAIAVAIAVAVAVAIAVEKKPVHASLNKGRANVRFVVVNHGIRMVLGFHCIIRINVKKEKKKTR